MIREAFIRWCERRIQRAPDKVICKSDGSAYLIRWHVIPRNRLFNIYWHEFIQSDEPRANHDHPWLFNASVYVKGNYFEVVGKDKDAPLQWRWEGSWKFRWGKSPHRVVLSDDFFGNELRATTIFLTGPVVREWGFYCPKGWVHWKLFTSLSDDGKTSTLSRGCE